LNLRKHIRASTSASLNELLICVKIMDCE
jgi:hypothetical protein